MNAHNKRAHLGCYSFFLVFLGCSLGREKIFHLYSRRFMEMEFAVFV